jgi:hypothetical protein
MNTVLRASTDDDGTVRRVRHFTLFVWIAFLLPDEIGRNFDKEWVEWGIELYMKLLIDCANFDSDDCVKRANKQP